MKASESRERNGGRRRICANERCGRPADGELCDACALERALFRRDERGAICRAETSPRATGSSR